MKEKAKITASIVLYNEDIETLQKTIDCFLKTPLKKQLFLIDNSSTDSLKKLANSPEIEYFFNDKNIGFGKAHNVVLEKINSEFHLILNPDVVFEPQVIPNLIQELEKKEEVTMISPKVIYPNGDLQNTCRKHPTVLEMIFRRTGGFKKMVKEKEYGNIDVSQAFYPEFIHGCFMLFKTADFIAIKGFDKRFFLYMEDADMCRKVAEKGKKLLYFPDEKIIHIHRKGSAKKMKLLYYHIFSAFKYFKKWGL